jgi:transposase InsO family protein
VRFCKIFNIRPVGRDYLAKLLRRYGLQVGRRKSRQVKTTYSRHTYAVQPNLLRGLEISAPEEVFVADITYLYVGRMAVYLFLITDAFSRMIVGHYLSKNLQHEGALKAWENALTVVIDPKGLIHHTDRGVQYCCHNFVNELTSKGAMVSMTDADHCAQNALAESMNGILKTEFLLDHRFSNFEQAQRVVRNSIFNYNHLRVHGSLEGKTPAEVHFGTDDKLELWANELKSQLPIPASIPVLHKSSTQSMHCAKA